MRVTLQDGRTMVGQMLAFDKVSTISETQAMPPTADFIPST